MRRKFYNNTNSINDWNSQLRSTEFKEILGIDLEAPQNVKTGPYGNIYTGYFKAPTTARYRFYMTCDDYCLLNFGNEPMNPNNVTKILEFTHWTSYRNYFNIARNRISSWVNLTQGEFYFIDARHIQGAGGDHFTVSVEIEDPNAPNGHHHSMREI